MMTQRKTTLLLLSSLLLSGCFDYPIMEHNAPPSEPVPQQVATDAHPAAIKLPDGITPTQLPDFDLTLSPQASFHTLSNGDRYYGALNQGNPHGAGQLYPRNQPNVVILGHFVNGRIIGTARYINPHIVYTGRIHPAAMQPHGYGISLAKESRYQGFFNQGLMEGDGTLLYTSGPYKGLKFKGEYRQGAPYQGEVTIPDEGVYRGVIENGIFKGEATYPDGRKAMVEEKLF